jgi:hypothetical protein
VFFSPSPLQPLLGAMFAAQWGPTFVGSTSSGGSDVSGRLERCQTVDGEALSQWVGLSRNSNLVGLRRNSNTFDAKSSEDQAGGWRPPSGARTDLRQCPLTSHRPRTDLE